MDTETRTPEIVLSDQGPNVDETEIRDALRKWGIEKRRSSPYHPQGDGQSERGIQTTKQTLRCMLAEKKLQKESWSKILQEVAYSLNTMPSASTGLTPFKIMFGVDPNRFPTLDPANQRNARIDMNSWCDELSHSVSDTNASANHSLSRYRDSVSGNVNRNRRHVQVEVGDQVYIRNETRNDNLDARFAGPYPVTQARGPNVSFEADDARRGVVHLDRCKLSRDLNSPIKSTRGHCAGHWGQRLTTPKTRV